MSDENKDLGDKAEDAFDNAKESAKEFSEDAKESAKDFSEGAKKTANEFSAGAKEAFSGAGGDNKKVLAGILAIFLGGLGVHKFILGYQKEGFILLGVSVAAWVLSCVGVGLLFVWIPGVIGLIEGIMYLTKSDEEFYNTYQVGRKPWF
ncbi:NINE protein [Maribacter stanieri]|mgnify:CR=1 FL=1|jgi:TM2 domain-containing membrane protein YozV|uniref:NINE protein n=1 Tax=Maribacter stanieri TaxID=440514 RepID=UPI002494AE22|nr:NINE protein [Maribacter stanieri]|tara:strand:- start:571 stop:1017 length:447 start_codon:yes stop_codon:yes gene_type:complete